MLLLLGLLLRLAFSCAVTLQCTIDVTVVTFRMCNVTVVTFIMSYVTVVTVHFFSGYNAMYSVAACYSNLLLTFAVTAAG